MIDLERHVEDLHPEISHSSNLTCRERFNSRLFRSDLVKYGPQYFDEFSAVLGKAEMVEQIPPARSLDVKQSTVAGNLQAIPEFLEQGGVGDPSEEVERIWERNVLSNIAYVNPFHGVLGTAYSIFTRAPFEPEHAMAPIPIRHFYHGSLPLQDGCGRRNLEDFHRAKGWTGGHNQADAFRCHAAPQRNRENWL
ncbi:hypothetical protein B0H13DRAFT_1854731 [Mycena leptocephala]|nr:hypothetical protein B0H13DRAFT_1854731 [Mycena leptocephala]